MEGLEVIFQNMDKGLSAVLLVYFIFKLSPVLGEIDKKLALLTRANDSVSDELENLQQEVRDNRRSKDV